MLNMQFRTENQIKCSTLERYHLHVPIVKKSGGLNLLESCGPLQACNGTASPYTGALVCMSLQTGTAGVPFYQQINKCTS